MENKRLDPFQVIKSLQSMKETYFYKYKNGQYIVDAKHSCYDNLIFVMVDVNIGLRRIDEGIRDEIDCACIHQF